MGAFVFSPCSSQAAELSPGFCAKLFATGPLSEFNLPKVSVHIGARDLFPSELSLKLNRLQHGQYGRNGYLNPNSLLWLRDYSPFYVHAENGLVALAYPTLRAGGEELFFRGDLHSSIKVERLPLFLEGGAVVPMGDRLFVSKKMLQLNQRSLEEVFSILKKLNQGEAPDRVRAAHEELKIAGYKVRNKEEVQEILANFFRIKKENIYFLDWLPGQRTGHVDDFMIQLKDKVIGMPKIPDYVLQELKDPELSFSRKFNQWIDKNKTELQAWLGPEWKLVELPMQAPRDLKASLLSEWGFDALYVSPTNSIRLGNELWLPVDRRQPQMRKFVGAKGLQEELSASSGALPLETLKRLEKDTENVLLEYGIKAKWAPIDRLISEYGNVGGLWHCMTNHGPATPN